MSTAPNFNQTPSPKLADGIRFYGDGDHDAAFAVFTECAEAGESFGWMWLAVCHAEGHGTEKCPQTAVHCTRKSAELGNPQAQCNLGVALFEGKGVTQDTQEGISWLRRAADQGDLNASFNLATVLSSGEAVKRDWREAAKYYGLAAEAGHPASQLRLGYLHRNGFGIPKNRIQAFLWTSLAARHGVGTALEQLEKIVFEMSSDEKSEATDLLRGYEEKQAFRSPTATFSVVTE